MPSRAPPCPPGGAARALCKRPDGSGRPELMPAGSPEQGCPTDRKPTQPSAGLSTGTWQMHC
eukprot:13562135-Alexandrium_andersonii.AAC.1